MNLTLTVHLRIQFSDTAALKYQGGKEGLWPSKSWSWKGRFPYFRTAFWLFCGFSFSETPVRHSMFAGYRRLMKHIKMMMVQQRMSSRMMLLPIPSVSRNSYKQTGIRQGRGIKLVSTWLFIYYSKVIPCKIEDLPDIFVTSNYFFRSSQKTTNYFYWTWRVFLVGKQMLKKSQLNKKKPHLTRLGQISVAGGPLQISGPDLYICANMIIFYPIFHFSHHLKFYCILKSNQRYPVRLR